MNSTEPMLYVAPLQKYITHQVNIEHIVKRLPSKRFNDGTRRESSAASAVAVTAQSQKSPKVTAPWF